MLQSIKNWLIARLEERSEDDDLDLLPPPNFRRTGTFAAKRSKTNAEIRTATQIEQEPKFSGKIESQGPGKNVLIRNRYVREDTGTHETLKILDDSMVDSGEETGIDPYNTGGFDRSKNWNHRFRK